MRMFYVLILSLLTSVTNAACHSEFITASTSSSPFMIDSQNYLYIPGREVNDAVLTLKLKSNFNKPVVAVDVDFAGLEIQLHNSPMEERFRIQGFSVQKLINPGENFEISKTLTFEEYETYVRNLSLVLIRYGLR